MTPRTYLHNCGCPSCAAKRDLGIRRMLNMVKPRICKHRTAHYPRIEIWRCTGEVWYEPTCSYIVAQGWGSTPHDAYARWAAQRDRFQRGTTP